MDAPGQQEHATEAVAPSHDPGLADSQPATPEASSSSPAPGKAGKAGRRRRKGKRRQPRRSFAGPAEPAAREAAAREALADLEPSPDETPADSAADAPPAEAPPVEYDPEAAARDAGAVFRVGLRALALGIRKRFPSAARSFFETAPDRGFALGLTVGQRLAGRLGAKLAIVAVACEVIEPFAVDAWNAAEKRAADGAPRE